MAGFRWGRAGEGEQRKSQWEDGMKLLKDNSIFTVRDSGMWGGEGDTTRGSKGCRKPEGQGRGSRGHVGQGWGDGHGLRDHAWREGGRVEGYADEGAERRQMVTGSSRRRD